MKKENYMGDDNHYYIYVKSKWEVKRYFRYGITLGDRKRIHNQASSDHKFNIVIDGKGIVMEKTDDGSYLLKSNIPPKNIIKAIDYENGETISRIIAEDEKPPILYHGTGIYNIMNILLQGSIIKSYNMSGDYVFCHARNMKSLCFTYFGGTGGLIEIDTSNYDIVELIPLPYEYGITDDVLIDDIVGISFYLNNKQICFWDKNAILTKRKEMIDNSTSLPNKGKHIYNISKEMSEQQIYDAFMNFVLW